MRSTPAYQWLSSFTRAPDYCENWDVARSAAFLTILESAQKAIKKSTPNLLDATVLRHRHRLLKKKSPPNVIAALALMTAQEIATHTSKHKCSERLITLTKAQITALDPSQDDIQKQSTPRAKSLKATHKPKTTNASAAPEHQPNARW